MGDVVQLYPSAPAGGDDWQRELAAINLRPNPRAEGFTAKVFMDFCARNAAVVAAASAIDRLDKAALLKAVRRLDEETPEFDLEEAIEATREALGSVMSLLDDASGRFDIARATFVVEGV